MGGGSYSSTSRMERSVRRGFAPRAAAIKSGLADDSYRASSREQIFQKRTIDNAMNPKGVQLRESRDSEEHPESLAVVIALDVTGSMGTVPEALVRDGLPHIMETILEKGVKDPQILFLAIGDHTCDMAPLQVGQFESSDELLDHWLTSVYLEGRGGGNDGESYHLAWYFAARHTAIDCLEKRGQKGFLFTIGDEPCLGQVREGDLKGIMGDGQFQDFTAAELLKMASEKYECFHINIQETNRGSERHTTDSWRELIDGGLIQAQRHTDVAGTIAQTILNRTGKGTKVSDIQGPSEEAQQAPEKDGKDGGFEPPPML